MQMVCYRCGGLWVEQNVSEAEQASLESEFNIRLIDTKDIYLSLARLEYNLVLTECYFV